MREVLTVCHQTFCGDVDVGCHYPERGCVGFDDGLHLRFRLLFRTVIPPLRKEFLEPVSVNEHSDELLGAMKPLCLCHPDNISARHRLRAVYPVRGDALANLV